LVVKALCLSLLPTPTKLPSNDGDLITSNRREISLRNISKQLGFSVGTGLRTLSLAKKKQANIAEGTKEGWIMLTEDEQRSKYTDELITALEYWIENNNMVCHSPFKDNLVIKQDWNGSIVRDPATGDPLRIQKMMLMCNPRVLHNHMIEHFDGATEGNCVLILENKLRELLKLSCSHIKKMSSREKMMCGCETCIIFNDMHECLNLFRKQNIARVNRELNTMQDGHRKFDLSAKLQTYMNQVCSNPNNHHYDPRYKSGWDAASALGCPPVTIDGRQYCKFACSLRECPECCDSWERFLPTMERECTKRISYVIFGTHYKCSYHSDASMRVKGKESICEQCENMPEERRKYLKGGIPKVKQVKLRIMLTEPLNEFLQPKIYGRCFNTRCT
jgi:hypothetical protein